MPVEAAQTLTIREYRPGDEAQILALFRRCFGVERTLDHWRWKFERNPFGNERISLAFDASGQLVGHFGGYAVPFRDRGDDYLAHQMGDSMTDPSARHIGRGPTSVFGRSMNFFYDRFSEGRIAFNYGFNVGNVQKFFIRFLSGEFIEPVPYRVRDLRAQPMRGPSRVLRRLRGYELELVREITPEWDELFERVWPAYEYLVRRNAAYVRWRYLEAPEPCVLVAIRRWKRLVGWSAFRVREKRLLWGDALFDRTAGAAPSILLRHVVSTFDPDSLEGWFPERPSWFAAILDDLGLESKPEPQGLSMIARAFERPEAIGRLKTGLYYTMADGDLF